MSYTILVTGGAGFVGLKLVNALVNDGHKVIVVDSLVKQVHSGKKPVFPKGVKFVHGNVGDRKLMAPIVSKVDIIFHQAAEVGQGQSMYEIERYCRENVQATAVLMELVSKNAKRIKKVIVAGSVASVGEGTYKCIEPDCGQIAYPWPRVSVKKKSFDYQCEHCANKLVAIPMDESVPLRSGSVYGLTKKMQEELVRITCDMNKIPWVSLRYFNIIGPGQSLRNPYTGVCMMFLNQLKEGKRPVIFEDGNQLRDFVSVYDIVQANVLAMRNIKVTGTFHIGTGVPHSVYDMAKKLAFHLGKPSLLPIVTKEFRKGDTRHLFADISKAKKELKYVPIFDLDDSLEQIIEWSKYEKAGANVSAANKELRKRGLLE